MTDIATMPATSADFFRLETADVVAKLRAALNLMVGAVTGQPLGKSRDAQKLFNVDVKLSWQLFRTLSGGDPFEAIGHIPPRNSFDKLLREARRKQVEESLVNDVERAYSDFENLVERHAGDRASFVRMLDGDPSSNADELPNRQAIFEASRQIWGTEMDVNLRATLLHPASHGRADQDFEMISLGVLRGFRRWTVEAPVLLFKHKFSSQVSGGAENQPQPLDRETFGTLGVPLLDRFSSKPRPALRTRRVGDDLVLIELASEAVGRLNSIDVAQGQFFPSVSLMNCDEGRLGWRIARINATPTRMAIIDFVVHRPTFGVLSCDTVRWGNVSSFPANLELLANMPDSPRLPNVDKVIYMGSASAAAATVGVTDYLELLRFACQQRGWNIDEMDLYRHQSDYPLQSTMDAAMFAIPGSKHWPRQLDVAQADSGKK